jgi:fumarylpyruvate hydrolase
VIALGAGGASVRSDQASALIFGYAVGIDLTRRDLQAAAKKAGRPWDMAKGFDHSAPIGPLTLGIPPPEAPISLSVDGQVRQSADLSDMIWKVPEIIASLSTFVALAPGDLIFTGTPSGVGPIAPGQWLHGSIGSIAPIDVCFQ